MNFSHEKELLIIINASQMMNYCMPSKSLKNKKKSKNNHQQQIKSKNKEKIEVIREKFKELAYKVSKSELKEIKRRLYMVENKKGLLGSKKTQKISR